jgi:hypothetical protein
MKIIAGKAEHQDLWSLFSKYWHSEGLDAAVLDGHDGVGQESWINLTLRIMPARPRSSLSAETHGLKSDLGVGEYRG